MSLLDLLVERPVAGGRMLARHEGRVVLVAGAIPGERIRARVERTAKHVTWATVAEVIEPSPDRRPVAFDPACGGLDYAHIGYDAQRALKARIVVDAFQRIGKMSIELPAVDPSPEHGYRLRARLHVELGRAGFFLEGTHALCDAAPTGQLRSEAMTAVRAAIARLDQRADRCAAIVVSENVRGTERVLHLEPRAGAERDLPRIATELIDEEHNVEEATGVTCATDGGLSVIAGEPTVTDRASDLFHADAPIPAETCWMRHATSFYQGNRYLMGALVRHVLDLGVGDRIVDLYSGAGLFAVAFAARGATVTAVEGDRSAAHDLDINAQPWRERLTVIRSAVEHAAPRLSSTPPETVVVDPPRTGMSVEAFQGVLGLAPRTLVYVSCDPATLARDAGKLVGAGYRIGSIRAFDLFPNTAHVETVVSFARGQD